MMFNKVSDRPRSNWGGTVDFARARGFEQPTSTQEVIDLVREAAHAGVSLKVIGTAGSASRILHTRGWLVSLQRMRGIREVEPTCLQKGQDAGLLVEVEAGATIAEVNAFLVERGLCLPMTTAFTGLSFVGAVSTASHGSGVHHPPMCDAVVGMELVTAQGQALWIEAASGPTDPRAHARTHPARELVQDDDLHAAALVSLGAMGIITRVRVQARPLFFLEERRARQSWGALRALLADKNPTTGLPRVFSDSFSFEASINPYKLPGRAERTAVLKRRVLSPHTTPPPGAERLKTGFKLDTRLLKAVDILTNDLNLGQAVPFVIESGLRQIALSPRLWAPGPDLMGAVAELPRGHSIEIAFPLADCIRCIESILQVLDRARIERGWTLSGWVSLRFVAPSRAWMAMTHGESPRCCVELVTLAGNRHLGGLWERLITRGLELGGRLHWGQYIAGDAGALTATYPHFDRWCEVVKGQDPDGRFENDFTRWLVHGQPKGDYP